MDSLNREKVKLQLMKRESPPMLESENGNSLQNIEKSKSKTE